MHETSKCGQFLMKIREEFEAITNNLMNRDTVLWIFVKGSFTGKSNNSLHKLSWSKKLKILLPFMLPILLRGILKEAFTRDVIPLPYLTANHQIVDVFTKALMY